MKWNPIKLIQITPQPHHPNPRKSFKNFGGNEVNSTPDFSERRNRSVYANIHDANPDPIFDKKLLDF